MEPSEWLSARPDVTVVADESSFRNVMAIPGGAGEDGATGVNPQ